MAKIDIEQFREHEEQGLSDMFFISIINQQFFHCYSQCASKLIDNSGTRNMMRGFLNIHNGSGRNLGFLSKVSNIHRTALTPVRKIHPQSLLSPYLSKSLIFLLSLNDKAIRQQNQYVAKTQDRILSQQQLDYVFLLCYYCVTYKVNNTKEK